MTNLISKIGAGILIAATGLVGLTGCATTPKSNIPRYAQQPRAEYTQSYAPAIQPQTVEKKTSDNSLTKAVVGGVLGAGLVGTLLPANMDSTARAATEAVTRGTGNGLLAHSTRPTTNVQVNVDGGYNSSAQSQGSYTPVQQTIDDRLLPEDNPAWISDQLDRKKVSGPSADAHYGGIYAIVTSRQTSDLNGDGVLQLNEFIGQTRNFKQRDPVNLNVCIRGCARSPFKKSSSTYDLTCVISDGNGFLVDQQVYHGKMDGYDRGEVLTIPLGDLKPGVYRAEFRYRNSNDKFGEHPSEEKTVFQVLEN